MVSAVVVTMLAAADNIALANTLSTGTHSLSNRATWFLASDLGRGGGLTYHE